MEKPAVGLDLLDIVFRVEKEFDVRISPDDLADMTRDRDIAVGDVYKLILKKVHSRDFARQDVRVNLKLWKDVQDLIHTAADVPLDQVELKTPLETLFPRKTRRAAWETLRADSPYRIRKLDYPKAVRWVALALALGMVLVEQFRIWQVPGMIWLWPALGLLGVWMLAETYAKVMFVFAPFRTRFPSGMRTVKDLCRAVLATNVEEICPADAIPPDDRSLEVWGKLRSILVDALGVDADQVTYDSRLVRDLAMT